MTIPPSAGKRSAAQARSRTARDKRNPVLSADAYYRLHLLRCARKDDGTGHDAEVGEPVALIGLQLVGCGDQAARLARIACIQSFAQRIENRGIEHTKS